MIHKLGQHVDQNKNIKDTIPSESKQMELMKLLWPSNSCSSWPFTSSTSSLHTRTRESKPPVTTRFWAVGWYWAQYTKDGWGRTFWAVPWSFSTFHSLTGASKNFWMMLNSFCANNLSSQLMPTSAQNMPSLETWTRDEPLSMKGT